MYLFISNKIINITLLLLPPFFMSWTQRSKTFSMYTKGLFLSNIVHKSVWICVSEHFFAEVIHPPHRCGISRCWLDSMIIAQVCLRLATIKSHLDPWVQLMKNGGKNKSVAFIILFSIYTSWISSSMDDSLYIVNALGKLFRYIISYSDIFSCYNVNFKAYSNTFNIFWTSECIDCS